MTPGTSRCIWKSTSPDQPSLFGGAAGRGLAATSIYGSDATLNPAGPPPDLRRLHLLPRARGPGIFPALAGSPVRQPARGLLRRPGAQTCGTSSSPSRRSNRPCRSRPISPARARAMRTICCSRCFSGRGSAVPPRRCAPARPCGAGATIWSPGSIISATASRPIRTSPTDRTGADSAAAARDPRPRSPLRLAASVDCGQDTYPWLSQ